MGYNTQRMLTDVEGKPIPQIYDPNSDRFLPLTIDVFSEVTVKNLNEELEKLKAELMRSHVGYSSEVKPAGKRGDTFLEIDTGNVYIHDGQKWVEL